jgi:hypothetical protein
LSDLKLFRITNGSAQELKGKPGMRIRRTFLRRARPMTPIRPKPMRNPARDQRDEAVEGLALAKAPI